MNVVNVGYNLEKEIGGGGVSAPRCFFRSWLLDGRSGKKVKRVGVVYTMLWVDVSECFRVGEWKVNHFCGVYILCGAALSEHFCIKPFYVAASWFGLSSSRKPPAALQIGVCLIQPTQKVQTPLSLLFPFFLHYRPEIQKLDIRHMLTSCFGGIPVHMKSTLTSFVWFIFELVFPFHFHYRKKTLLNSLLRRVVSGAIFRLLFPVFYTRYSC